MASLADFSGVSVPVILWATSSIPQWVSAAQQLASNESAASKPSEYVKAAEGPFEAVALTLDSCPLLLPATGEAHSAEAKAAALVDLENTLNAHKLGDGTILNGIIKAIQAAGGVNGIIQIVQTIIGAFGGKPAPTPAPVAGS